MKGEFEVMPMFFPLSFYLDRIGKDLVLCEILDPSPAASSNQKQEQPPHTMYLESISISNTKFDLNLKLFHAETLTGYRIDVSQPLTSIPAPNPIKSPPHLTRPRYLTLSTDDKPGHNTHHLSL
jgi:hypothetical protein